MPKQDTANTSDYQPEYAPKPTSDYLEEYIESLGDGTKNLIGIETGLGQLDKATLGLDGLIVLGGIAGKGKTSLALQLALDACVKGTPIIFYSLEMPRRAVITKLLSRLAKISYSDILLAGRHYLADTLPKNLLGENLDTKGYFTREGFERLKKAKAEIAKVGKDFYIRDKSDKGADGKYREMTLDAVEQEVNLIKAKTKADKLMVVVDHLQVFKVDSYRDQIDKEGLLINGFKELNERTGATVLLISQKNKAGFTSSGLEAIKGSVDITYLADLVLMLDTKEEKDGRKGKKDYGGEVFTDLPQPFNLTQQVDLVITKNRYNAPKVIKLNFNGKFADFTEI